MQQQTTRSDLWTYSTGIDAANIAGYEVEATDGGIGKIDRATNDVGSACVVVDTGPWIFGKKVMLPAGVIERVDRNEEKVYVARTKDEIKNAPDYDDDRFEDDAYRDSISSHYGRL